jgi:DNA-binding response OmpR family regulator
MLDSHAHPSSAARAARADRHCLIASDDPETIAEVGYHVARLGLTVSTTEPGADLLTAVSQRVPQLLVASMALLAGYGPTFRRDVREATGRWGLALVVVARGESTGAGDDHADADAVIQLPRASSAIGATLRRAVERADAREAALGRAGGAPPLLVRREAREVRVNGRWVRLSETELRIVEALLRSPGGLSDVGLEDRVWGAPQRRGFRGLITVVARLRRKLTPHGVGVERAPELTGYRLRW